MERQEDGPSAQCHEDRPTDKNHAVNSGNVKPWCCQLRAGKKLLDYQLRSKQCLEKLESLVKNGGQSKVVPEEMPAKLANVFSKGNCIKFNQSLIILFLKKLNDALEADTSEDRSTFFEEGTE